jgi:HPt (histidine-containing phosphotransfer) domain-containing protein
MHRPPPESQHAIDEIRLIGGEELVREMAATFARFATAQVERLAEATDAGSLDQVASFAQALHASARQMGARRLTEAASSLEVAARGRDAAMVVQGVGAVRAAVADARRWLDVLAGP